MISSVSALARVRSGGGEGAEASAAGGGGGVAVVVWLLQRTELAERRTSCQLETAPMFRNMICKRNKRDLHYPQVSARRSA